MAARQSEKEWSGIMVVMRDFIQSIYRFESVKWKFFNSDSNIRR